MPDAAAPSVLAPTRRKRHDPWFDNAKMALVALVVVGHAWTLLPLFANDPGSGTAKLYDNWLYHFLYAWHIPAFVIVTGYLSRSFEWTRARLWALVTTIAIPYFIFEGLYAWYRHEALGVNFERLWANPHWPMWYLSAVFFWRLMTPLFRRMPLKVVVAVAISLAAGLFVTDLFDNARILGLLPFFVLGLKMHEGHWNLLRTRRARWYGFAVLLALLVLARLADGWLENEWFYWRSRYDVVETDILRAFVIRMVLLLIGLLGAFAFFAVVPRTKSWFSALGGATLVVYLYHGFFVLTAEALGFQGWAEAHWPLSLALVTGMSVPVALFLAWPPVSTRLNLLVDPVGSLSRARRRRRDRDPSSV